MPRVGLSIEQILTEAAEVADREGLSALTLSALAERLKIRSPSLLHHVGSLRRLQERLGTLGCRRLREALSQAALGRAGADAVRSLAHAFRAFAQEHPGLYAAVQLPPPADDAEAVEEARKVVEVVALSLRGVGLPEAQGVHAVRALRAGLHGFVVLELQGGFGLPDDVDESFEALVEVLVDGLSHLQLRSSAGAARARPRARGASRS